ncbi:TPA: LysR family transcriptional regulator [Raoultella ornithinolytica]|uniref:LysR family transcriptional regulator n=1 Tax=Raoultella ornithinolytica TaxID=54291 RepID=UPI0007CCF53B|nr:LysR family transcriptional regulator [Raoultella ornithinolytica]MDS0886249.1 LysR family transcriptional regulator [Raoultella ornithinolytica]MEB6461294.1 LysR family transcriptional regulator [Raoultella ornithinolytica]QPG42516.1 LysR family transcriptional regulator [Raoultella ornithinolytica]SBL25484.1 transcriptional regulator [Raoultella ornithinolytica]HDG9830720.1 LysR family transcriptional regulator [Raoultella ornithinolytica]
MADPDFNLLVALDILLAEESVAGAARRSGLSASAMSRTLTRLREVTGDPLLVRAGRKMVLTPHAQNLKARTQNVVSEMRSVLNNAAAPLHLPTLEQTFTLRTNEGFVDAFAPALICACAAQAPGVKLNFVAKSEKGPQFLRDGSVDLEIGVLKNMGPEIRLQALFRDRFVGVVAKTHPLAQGGQITRERYAACEHVIVSRHGMVHGPVDQALAELGLSRKIAAVVPGFTAALAVARGSQLVALVPASCLRHGLQEGIVAFELPVSTPEITVSQMWHPRQELAPGHAWLRQQVLSVCRPVA